MIVHKNAPSGKIVSASNINAKNLDFNGIAFCVDLKIVHVKNIKEFKIFEQ